MLTWILCGGSESLCQRFVLKLMTCDMGKKVNSKRALRVRAARYKVKKQIFRRERQLEGPQVIFNSLRYCVS